MLVIASEPLAAAACSAGLLGDCLLAGVDESIIILGLPLGCWTILLLFNSMLRYFDDELLNSLLPLPLSVSLVDSLAVVSNSCGFDGDGDADNDDKFDFLVAPAASKCCSLA